MIIFSFLIINLSSNNNNILNTRSSSTIYYIYAPIHTKRIFIREQENSERSQDKDERYVDELSLKIKKKSFIFVDVIAIHFKSWWENYLISKDTRWKKLSQNIYLLYMYMLCIICVDVKSNQGKLWFVNSGVEHQCDGGTYDYLQKLITR